MPRPTGDYSKMTPEEQKEYQEYTAHLKIYARGKVYAWIDVDKKVEKETLEKILRASTDIRSAFDFDTFHELMKKAGYTKEKAEEYASRLRILDDTYTDERWD